MQRDAHLEVHRQLASWAEAHAPAPAPALALFLGTVRPLPVGAHVPAPALHPVAQVTATHLVLIPTILGWFLALSPRDGTRAARRCGELGKLTYSTYMIHFPLQLAAVTCLDALGLSRGIFYSAVALLLFVSTVLAAGYGLFTWFEMPMQAYLRARLLPADAAPAGVRRAR